MNEKTVRRHWVTVLASVTVPKAPVPEAVSPDPVDEHKPNAAKTTHWLYWQDPAQISLPFGAEIPVSESHAQQPDKPRWPSEECEDLADVIRGGLDRRMTPRQMAAAIGFDPEDVLALVAVRWPEFLPQPEETAC
jgi:hypothetical protein